MTTKLQKLELKDLSELKRVGDAMATDDVVYYYKVGKKLGFVGVSGGPVSTANTVTVWYSRSPLSDGSEDLSDSVLPIVDKRWDDALTFGACFEITGDTKWLLLYEKELERMRTLQNTQIDRSYLVPSNRDYD